MTDTDSDTDTDSCPIQTCVICQLRYEDELVDTICFGCVRRMRRQIDVTYMPDVRDSCSLCAETIKQNGFTIAICETCTRAFEIQ